MPRSRCGIATFLVAKLADVGVILPTMRGNNSAVYEVKSASLRRR